jgi:hypothetical protein
VVDRLVGMAGMAVMVPFGLPSFLAATRPQGILPVGQPFFLAAAATSTLGKWVGPFWEKGMRLLRKFWAALMIWRQQPRALLRSFGFTWINMLCLFSVIYVLFGGLNESLPLWLIGGLYSIVYFDQRLWNSGSLDDLHILGGWWGFAAKWTDRRAPVSYDHDDSQPAWGDLCTRIDRRK